MSRADWHEVLEAQAYVARFLGSAKGHQWARTFASTMALRTEEEAWQFASDGRESMYRAALMGEPYWVARDMVTFTEVATEEWPGEPLTADDLPSRHGFVVLERSVSAGFEEGKAMYLRAFSWFRSSIIQKDGTEKEGVSVSIYADRDDPLDETMPSHSHGADFPKWFPFHVATWKFGFEEPTLDKADTSKVNQPYFNFIRVFWTLVKQEIPMVSRGQPDRAARRRIARERGPDHIPTIRIVDLRKTKTVGKQDDEDHEPGYVEWSHRWIVRGFWRKQWYAHDGVHRLKYIHSYVKGPPDRPLIVKKVVNRVVR